LPQVKLISADEPGRKTFHHPHAEIYQFHPVKAHVFLRNNRKKIARPDVNRWPGNEWLVDDQQDDSPKEREAIPSLKISNFRAWHD